ncbi:MAG: D-2-hydroxyacid dehydrogenase [Hyphomicrobiaceae bacterium]
MSVGINQYDVAAFRARGVRLANARGVNERAVAEHALALILALTRKLHTGRDRQTQHRWRPMIGDSAIREEEIGGKTLLIVGLGTIGRRLAHLAKAFDMHVIATRRDAAAGKGPADEVFGQDRLPEVLPRADIVALTCPLTPETDKLIGTQALQRMKPTAYLVNVARGRVVDEPALIAALADNRIAGAALDCVWQEPLPADSPLWSFENVLITPHTAGETRLYEERVIDVLVENLERLWRGETHLQNEIV